MIAAPLLSTGDRVCCFVQLYTGKDDATSQGTSGILTLDENPVFGNSAQRERSLQVWTTSTEVFQPTPIQNAAGLLLRCQQELIIKI